MSDLLLTPSKVTAWLDCAHFLALQHSVQDGELQRPATGLGEFAQLMMDKGGLPEQVCIDDYAARGITVHEVAPRRERETFAQWVLRVGHVLAEGHQVVYQMPFVHGGLRGAADFLERVDLPDGSFT